MKMYPGTNLTHSVYIRCLSCLTTCAIQCTSDVCHHQTTITLLSSGLLHSVSIELESHSLCQVETFLPLSWRRLCLERWSLRMNFLLQIGQVKFFSPVCVRLCRDNSSDRANFLVHPSHIHWNGFSPAENNIT